MAQKKQRDISEARAEELKEKIVDYLEAREKIPTGLKEWDRIKRRQEEIKKYFHAADADWKNWRWQIKNRISDVNILKDLLPLSNDELADIDRVGKTFRWAVSPYYLSLINPEDKDDPVRKQALPQIAEVEDPYGIEDPMAEEVTNPAPGITRRYPDRLIINVTNQCAMYCRHCQRRRNIGEIDKVTSQKQMEAALDYIRSHPEIRDVLLTGGDAFMLSNNTLDWLLTELDNIPHVEIKRLGTRTPVTLPYRITDQLAATLGRHLPLYVNTQFNHPLEITPDAREACFKLARAGVALGNQSVLLAGINNDKFVMRKLCQELLRAMVKPYYIFHAKQVKGTSHFRTKVEEGIEIMEHLRGYTSGLAIPTFIVNAPDGHGKTPMLPEYLISQGKDYIVLRTWENKTFVYRNQ